MKEIKVEMDEEEARYLMHLLSADWAHKRAPGWVLYHRINAVLAYGGIKCGTCGQIFPQAHLAFPGTHEGCKA